MDKQTEIEPPFTGSSPADKRDKSPEANPAGRLNISKLDESRLPRTIFSLIWPVVIQESAFGVLAMVATFLVGKFGAAAITAVGLGENIVHLPEVAFAGIAVGATAIIARHVGAGETQQVNRSVQQAMLLSLVLGTVFAIIWWFTADWWLVIFRARPEVIGLGRDFIRINAPAIPAFFILYCGESLMRGSGDTRTPMIVTVSIELIGAVAAVVLIRGFWFVPAMGVIGAAIARVIVSVLGALLIIILLVRGCGILKWDLRTALKFDYAATRRILRIGLPAFIDAGQMRAAMSVYQIIISSLGTVSFAAHSLAMRVEEFAFMPAWGFSVAATTLVGQYLGAKRPDLAEKAAGLARRYCLIAMISIGLLTVIFGQRLLDVFIDDPEVIRLGTLGLLVWAV
ncbi:MAG: MATE family efflux transporter, partial [Dehalococcoidia bacterium]|nr:MATE family efflux transporter [Dehalococcoidia bacterium]